MTDRQALLRGRLAAAGLREPSAGPDIPARPVVERAALSFPQEQAWRYQRARPRSVSNNLGLLLRFSGTVDEHALTAAVAGVVQRHEILRTTYHIDPEGQPYQRIHTRLPPRTTVCAATTEDADRLAHQTATEPFDLSAEGPLRLLIARTGPSDVTMALAVHHIVWDGATFGVLSREIEHGYRAPTTGVPEGAAKGGRGGALPALPLQYADVAEWQRHRHDDVVARERGFWSSWLAPPWPSPGLPTDRTAPAVAGEAGGRMDRRFAPASVTALHRLASACRVTPFVAFLSCWAAVLGAGTAAADHAGGDGACEVMVGTTVLNRDHRDLAPLIGNLANHLVLRLPADCAAPADLVPRVQAATEAAFAHRELPYETVLDALAVRDPSGRPRLFDSLVVFIPGDTEGPQLPGASTCWQRLDLGAVQFPLVPLGLEVFVRGRWPDATIDLEVTYSHDLFNRETVAGLVGRLERTVCDMAGAVR